MGSEGTYVFLFIQIRARGIQHLDTLEWDQLMESARAWGKHSLDMVIDELYDWRAATYTRLHLTRPVDLGPSTVAASVAVGSTSTTTAAAVVAAAAGEVRDIGSSEVGGSPPSHLWVGPMAMGPRDNHGTQCVVGGAPDEINAKLWVVAIDFVFGHACLVVLSNLCNGDSLQLSRLELTVWTWLERTLIMDPKQTAGAVSGTTGWTGWSNSTDGTAPTIVTRRDRHVERGLFHVAAEILGLLSSCQSLVSLAERLVAAIDKTSLDTLENPNISSAVAVVRSPAPPTVALALRRLRALAFLELDLRSVASVVQSTQVVQVAMNLFIHLHGIPSLKDAVCRALTSLLLPLASFRLGENVDCSPWFNVMSALYDRMQQWGEKDKHQAVALPLLTSMCVFECERMPCVWSVMMSILSPAWVLIGLFVGHCFTECIKLALICVRVQNCRYTLHC